MQIRPHAATRSTSSRRTLLRPAAALLAVGLVAAACGGSDAEDTIAVASLDEPTTETTSEPGADDAERTDEEAMLAFSQCVRANGVDDFPDPSTSRSTSFPTSPPWRTASRSAGASR